MFILGVRVDNFSREEVLSKIESFLADGKFHQIATINPEIILKAQGDRGYREILNSCDLNVADGMGINFAFWKKGEKLKARFPGVDLMQEILKIAEKRKIKIFLAANSGGLSNWEETAEAIKKLHPNLDISGANVEPRISNYKLPTTCLAGRQASYKLLLCNFGAPYQERFLNNLKNDIMGIAVGVGGSFDCISGKIRRAPLWMRKIGLEWLWRLILQPKRIGRIFRAIIIFPIKVIFN